MRATKVEAYLDDKGYLHRDEETCCVANRKYKIRALYGGFIGDAAVHSLATNSMGSADKLIRILRDQPDEDPPTSTQRPLTHTADT